MRSKVIMGIILIPIMVRFVPSHVDSQSTTLFDEWNKVNAWVYQLQDFDVEGISNANAELAVIDYSYDGTEDQEVPKSDVLAMKSGEYPKALIAYMSIGEAEDYRFYWREEWNTNPPSWLGPENPSWPGNYKVRYWDPEWQKIIFGTPESYLDRIIKAGFDGVYLDIIDAYEFFEDERPSARADMIDFVISIAEYARNQVGESFGVFPQNAEELLEDNRYISTITGLGREEVYYIATNEPRPPSETRQIEEKLDLLIRNNKLALVVDYATKIELVTKAYERAQEKGYVPYVTEVKLNKLTPTYNDYLTGKIHQEEQAQDFFLSAKNIGLYEIIGIITINMGMSLRANLRKSE